MHDSFKTDVLHHVTCPMNNDTPGLCDCKFPRIEGCVWVNVRGKMRPIPKKGFFICTVDKNGGNDFKENEYPCTCDTEIYKDGVRLTNVRKFHIHASADDMDPPLISVTYMEKKYNSRRRSRRKY